jgi:hypothetical protein
MIMVWSRVLASGQINSDVITVELVEPIDAPRRRGHPLASSAQRGRSSPLHLSGQFDHAHLGFRCRTADRDQGKAPLSP